MARKPRQEGEPIIIKKYANRRLYNTESSSYVTLDNLADMVRDGEDFVVQDAKTGDDLTRSVLAQIIFDRESKDKTLLPLPFLRQLVGMYGDGVQAMVPPYLEAAMQALTQNQEQIRDAFASGQGTAGFMPIFENMARQNMNIFEQTMRMWNPMQDRPVEAASPAAQPSSQAQPKTAENNAGAENASELAALKAQLDALKSKVDALG